MTINFVQNWLTFTRHADIPKRIQIGPIAVTIQTFNDNILATLCVNLMIGPVTSEITRVESATFQTTQQKSTYIAEYLSESKVLE